LVVGVGELFVTTYPGFGVDAVEVVVGAIGGAVVAISGGDAVVYVVVGVNAIS
jgi:hypothetical protein